MKITWNWLSEYVDLTGLTPDQVAEDLTNAGIPVERVSQVATGVANVVVGAVRAVKPHPESDHLHVCEVEAGTGRMLTIVCGAANVAAGQLVPTALVGAALPGTTISKATIRGVDSEGMICSAAELGLDVKLLSKEQTSGILVLPEDAPVGQAIAEYLNLDDTVLELELTPNRVDCLSLRGVAYEVGALYGRPARMPETGLAADGQETRTEHDEDVYPLSVKLETKTCLGYAARVVTGLKLGPSPMWMQMRLLAVGVRPINNLVDITNYVMFEWGQPLHAFDYDAISDGQIIVREALEGERLVTLDGQERRLPAGAIVIADPLKGVGLAGVMGGANSEVRSATQAVVIESALFDPLQVRRTAKALGLRSEAGARFEKGIDPAVTIPALERAADLMAAYAGGQVGGQRTAVGPALEDPETEWSLECSPEYVSRMLGYEVSAEEMKDAFARLGFTVEEASSILRVLVPSRRPDVRIKEDLVEEVGRLLGYDRIPATAIEGEVTVGKLSLLQYLRRHLRATLAALGLQEVWTYSFVSASDATSRLGLPDHHPLAPMIPLLRPLSEERSALRSTLLLSLLEVARYNVSRRNLDLHLFEVGTVFHANRLPLQDLPEETEQVAGLVCGRVDPLSPFATQREVDFFDVKGLVEKVLLRAGVAAGISYERSAEPYFHSGQAADVILGGLKIGRLGQLKATVATAYDLQDAFYFELDLPALATAAMERLHVRELPRFPASERDLAVVVARGVATGDLLQTVRAHAGDYLADVYAFDVYTGDKVAANHKSVALRLAFQAADRTLTESDVEEAFARVLTALEEEHGAILRG